DEAAAYFSTQNNLVEGFVTAIGFLWSLHLVSLEVSLRDLAGARRDVEALRGVARDSWGLARLLASCRKDVFIGVNAAILRDDGPRFGEQLARSGRFDARHFRVDGEPPELALDPRCVERAPIDPTALPRRGCPSMGGPLRGMFDWTVR